MNIIEKLDSDKIKINWNKNPIEMSIFLSFLTIEVEKVDNHLGMYTGWTRYENNDYKLIISGGIVNSKQYLDSLQFGINLSNPYNNYVNPFYLFDIMNSDGRKFFLDYYKDDMIKIQVTARHKITLCLENLKEARGYKKAIEDQLKAIKL